MIVVLACQFPPLAAPISRHSVDMYLPRAR